MDIEYDAEVDAAFVWIIGRPPDDHSDLIAQELWPEELKGKIGLLFDHEKRLIGLEVLQASSHLAKETLDGLLNAPQ